jgi:hypothetical protein
MPKYARRSGKQGGWRGGGGAGGAAGLALERSARQNVLGTKRCWTCWTRVLDPCLNARAKHFRLLVPGPRGADTFGAVCA